MNNLVHIVNILLVFFRKRDLNLKLILSNYLNGNQTADSGKVTNTVYGIVRNELVLIYIIEDFSKQKFKTYSLETKILLLSGVYLLLFSSSFPDYAVVNEIVKAAKKKRKSFINGMLRRIVREKPDLQILKKRIKSLNIRYSGSPFYIEKVKKFQNNTLKTLEYLNKEPVFHIKPNLARISYSKSGRELEIANIDYREIRELKTFEIKKAGKVISEFVDKGIFYFQNSGSQLVSIIASHFSGRKTIDCCSAPGTKSATLHFLKPEVHIVANDKNFKRMRLLKNFMKSYDISGIDSVSSDILKNSFNNMFDLYLVDAPCSSAGTIRKNPDLKLKLSKKRIEENSRLQKKILDSVVGMTLPGNTIIYSVCSFIEEESEKVIDDVLIKSENRSIITIDIKKIAEKLGFRVLSGEYGIFLLPSDRLNNDLFYISALRVL